MVLLLLLPTPPTLDTLSHDEDSEWPVQGRERDLGKGGLPCSTCSCPLLKTSCAFSHLLTPD